ncbi:MAG: glycosyltransferase family 39 protein [Acidobacteria bacterium]|nr:glycosyltransferase family 39 protein [Acidobacteriota bacterium]
MRASLAVLFFVLLLRVPFLHQAVQGDDADYLRAAQYAQIDPLHPSHLDFLFQGQKVTMRGHPHPPGNVWVLAALLAATGDIHEATFHAFYIVFSLIAAFAALSLARRFSAHPLLATLLFLATPAFVINGNSFESDIPFLAFWLASIAFFVQAADRRSTARLAASIATMALAAMFAFQAVLLIPILALYLWRTAREWKPAWATLLAVPLTLGAYQLFERLTSQQLPAEVLAQYFTRYNLHSLDNKIRNAIALTTHLGTMVFPALPLAFFRPLLGIIPILAGIAAIGYCLKRYRDFLAQWVLLFFAAALILFFAGSARYLLPLALPVAILIANQLKPAHLVPFILLQTALGMGLALANYDHWDGYRRAIASLEKSWEYKRVWINGEMGMRYYAESAGALPLERGQALRPGDIVVTSKWVSFPLSGGLRVPLLSIPIQSAVPLRLAGLNSESAYSTAQAGRLPFDVRRGPIDILQIETVAQRKPALSYLPMNAPESDAQIVSGLDRIEDNRYRWMSGKSVILLKPPATEAPIDIDIFLPDAAVATRLTVTLNGKQIHEASLPAKGAHKITTPPVKAEGDSAVLTLEVDRTFQIPGDIRTLGLILTGAGFR